MPGPDTFSIRPLREEDLPQAEAIYRESFRSFTGIPERMFPQHSYVTTRFRRDPAWAWAAVDGDGKLMGSHVCVQRGSLVVLGPLTLRPNAWGSGAFAAFGPPLDEMAERRGCRVRAIFTFAHSPKHVEGIGKHAKVSPRYLSVVMQRPIQPGRTGSWIRISTLDAALREEVLQGCRALTDRLLAGLDLTTDIQSALNQGIGEAIFQQQEGRVTAFALCHLGQGSEAGTETCSITFATVAPGPDEERHLEELLGECEALGASAGMKTLHAGVGYGRTRAMALMRRTGFRTFLQGISMSDAPWGDFLYDRPDALVVDDWR